MGHPGHSLQTFTRTLSSLALGLVGVELEVGYALLAAYPEPATL
jgi:hypothetical protein